MRKAAAKALANVKGIPATKSLAVALRDQDVGVRRAATRALASKDARAVEPLIAALKDPDSNMHQ